MKETTWLQCVPMCFLFNPLGDKLSIWSDTPICHCDFVELNKPTCDILREINIDKYLEIIELKHILALFRIQDCQICLPLQHLSLMQSYFIFELSKCSEKLRRIKLIPESIRYHSTVKKKKWLKNFMFIKELTN